MRHFNRGQTSPKAHSGSVALSNRFSSDVTNLEAQNKDNTLLAHFFVLSETFLLIEKRWTHYKSGKTTSE